LDFHRVARRGDLWETVVMWKPKLISVTELSGIIVQGTCPICRAIFRHKSGVGEENKNDLPDQYEAHLKEKHPDVLKEDSSQAAARIVREATKD
jgi:hypothetical protein